MGSRPRIDVVGLGPAGHDLVTRNVEALVAEVGTRFVRTSRHPSAHVVDAVSFDSHYEQSDSFDAVYESIVQRLFDQVRHTGRILYAVPGSPRVAEHTVDLLCERAASYDVDVVVHPALSFLDIAWVRLGVDPISEGVRIIDGHRFATEAAGERGPLLVAQCHSQEILSDIKLSIDEPGDATAIVLQRLGAIDEHIAEVPWADLDREIQADHLTSIWIQRLNQPVGQAFVQLQELVDTLRVECPWDVEQTHGSLRRYLLEESYETLEVLDGLSEALDADPIDDDLLDDRFGDLEEELGDLLYQVFFHARLASEHGRFTAADVAIGIHNKLVHRHPHVFGEAAATLDSLAESWERSKKDEKGRSSVMDGIPAVLPALLYTSKVQKKAAAIGLHVRPESTEHALTAAAEAIATLRDQTSHAATRGDVVALLADALFALVEVAETVGVDSETVLRSHAAAFADKVRVIETDAV